MVDVNAELERILSDPNRNVEIVTPYSGIVRFSYSNKRLKERATTVKEGDSVVGPRGNWKEIPGTPLFEIERQGSKEIIYSPTNGTVSNLESALEGKHAEAFTHVMTIQHPLTSDEVIEEILRKVLVVLEAPEDATYILNAKQGSLIRPGIKPVIMAYMKRDVPVRYNGKDGILYAVYFANGQRVAKGSPLLGICPEEQLEEVKRMEEIVRQKWKRT
ncbi:hypothetical protein D6745_05095 [Candidatus Woesearchaeota archaeon]|nr:MAG: hypothetical protein D6745_05095 [Candidatus Woesearchaeota archaeon]